MGEEMPDLRVKVPNLTASIEWRARIKASIEVCSQEEEEEDDGEGLRGG